MYQQMQTSLACKLQLQGTYMPLEQDGCERRSLQRLPHCRSIQPLMQFSCWAVSRAVVSSWTHLMASLCTSRGRSHLSSKAARCRAKVTREAYWQIDVDAINVPGASVCKGGCPAIVDSGTSLLVGPSLQIAAINKVGTSR